MRRITLIVAEQFGTLEFLFPGRIDLGLGRAPRTDPLTERASSHARAPVYNRRVRFMRKLLIVPAALFAAAAMACGDSPTSPTPTFTQTDLRVGSGDPAANGNALTVQYTGWLYDDSKPDQKGLQFDSNAGGTPFKFVLGAGQVIAGWDQGLVGIQAGGIRRLVIPPSLGYGGIRRGPIPPESTLIFDVEVTAIEVPQ